MTVADPAQALRLQAVLELAAPGARGATRRLVLTEALACFNARGLEATTIDDVRKASGQSVGTIYHHFSNKEGVAAALFFAGFDDQSRAIAARIAGLTDSRDMVTALVGAYVDWITELPALAQFLFLARETVGQGAQSAVLDERLEARYQPVDACFARDAASGRLLDLPEEVIPALVLGPAESYSRSWLAGHRKGTPASHGALLAEAAWRSLARQP